MCRDSEGRIIIVHPTQKVIAAATLAEIVCVVVPLEADWNRRQVSVPQRVNQSATRRVTTPNATKLSEIARSELMRSTASVCCFCQLDE